MRVLLVQPPHHNPAFAFAYATEPLALQTVGAALCDDDVTLLDLRFSGSTLEQVVSRIDPDVVATGGLTSDLPAVIEILRTVKRLEPGILTVVGGHHATMSPEDLCLPLVDAIVLGMGEETLPELVRTHEAGRDLSRVAGLALPRGTTLHRTAARPFPHPTRWMRRRRHVAS